MTRALAVLAVLALIVFSVPALAGWRVVADKTVPIGGHPESVAYDAAEGVFYLSNFGPQLKPTQADGAGYISKLSLDGKVLEKKFLPPSGVKLNKPKGVWVEGGRLWTTDIDSVWCFDLKSKKSRRVLLPSARFANDVTVSGGKLFVSDSSAGLIYLVDPADFLAAPPKVRVMLSPPGFMPNGLYPDGSGGIIIATMSDMGGPGGLFRAGVVGQMAAIREVLGRLDGVALLPGGAILYTDWSQGGLFILEPGSQPRLLAGGFKGPADFAYAPRGKGFLVAAPDLKTGDLRLISLDP